MIRFSLHCDAGHDFEAWFRGNDDFETQRQRGLVSCPTCGSAAVEKALMAPAVSTARVREARLDAVRQALSGAGAGGRGEETAAAQTQPGERPDGVSGVAVAPRERPEPATASGQVAGTARMPTEVVEKLRALRSELVTGATDVGEAFPEEARKIHYGEAEARGIYGAASGEEVRELLDEGIAVLPLPVLPEDHN
ncbi:MAG: hypothetical protein CMN87_15050 [Stappia sp.]|uniref:DUF1178 family protein n=1 Tax=Stappia sp. TaxID=1870903 RepID=UPI000C5E409D|nr:DUF1178 family protein [Stappia sp.]MAA98484.1 hypothetical protein [Stappia sp.]MBM21324.1 hypothetical protein [Stappia sp.]|tara:strand:- start:129 stop:713 length:585 start_codon:yes stop_codon:yes gene_type:complete